MIKALPEDEDDEEGEDRELISDIAEEDLTVDELLEEDSSATDDTEPVARRLFPFLSALASTDALRRFDSFPESELASRPFESSLAPAASDSVPSSE